MNPAITIIPKLYKRLPEPQQHLGSTFLNNQTANKNTARSPLLHLPFQEAEQLLNLTPYR